MWNGEAINPNLDNGVVMLPGYLHCAFFGVYTVPEKMACMWFGEVYSCCC